MVREFFSTRLNRKEIFLISFSKKEDIIGKEEMREANGFIVVLKRKGVPIFIVNLMQNRMI